MNTVTSKLGLGLAHSKLILVGEHAVVYGKPTIALPFPLQVRVIVQESHGKTIFESGYIRVPLMVCPISWKEAFSMY